MAIYSIEIASHSFAMTFINGSPLNATWYAFAVVKAHKNLDKGR